MTKRSSSFFFERNRMSRESIIQHRVIKELERKYPGAVVIKTDPNYIQGFPDLIFFEKYFWAALEVKRSINAPRQPNQKYWVDYLDDMSFASFVYPENMKEVLDGIQQAFIANRPARFS